MKHRERGQKTVFFALILTGLLTAVGIEINASSTPAASCAVPLSVLTSPLSIL
ncbi:MAG: hypothetical protein AB1345_01180 [Chloroflexota bacterium]